MRNSIWVRQYRNAVTCLLAILFSAALFIGCASTEAQPVAEAPAPVVDEADWMDISGVDMTGIRLPGVPAARYVFEDSEQWEAFLSEHHKGPAPEIDFGDSTLVAVFLGARPHSGYGVKIVSAEEKERMVVVNVVEYTPAPGMMYAQAIVHPYDMALIPTTGKPIQFVTTKEAGRPK